MNSSYLNRPLRSEAEYMRERDRDYLPDDPAIAELQHAIVACGFVVQHLVEAERHLPAGDGMDDELRGMSDIVADIRGRIARLERMRR